MTPHDQRLAEHARKTRNRLVTSLQTFADSGLDPDSFPIALLDVAIRAALVTQSREQTAAWLEQMAGEVRAGGVTEKAN